MRHLGVDFGEKRVGLAVSDENGSIVVPIGTIHRKSDDQAVRAVAEAAHTREVGCVVVGLPRNLDGSDGPITRRAMNFARRLAAVSGLQVVLHDEGLTSVAAEQNLRDAGIGGSRLDAARDAEAAAVLLRDYLEDPS